MAWHVSGQSMEFCSCNAFCPCWLGPDGKPDQDWCGGGFAFDIQQGESDGVDLRGLKVVFLAYWPANFFAGDGTARLYIDNKASADQRRELEQIFSGRKGGALEPLFQAVISNWLPAKPASIDLQWGDNPQLAVDGVGKSKLVRMKDHDGRPTRIQSAAAQSAFGFESMDLASSKGSHWSDPDMQHWDADSATLHAFDWKS